MHVEEFKEIIARLKEASDKAKAESSDESKDMLKRRFTLGKWDGLVEARSIINEYVTEQLRGAADENQ